MNTKSLLSALHQRTQDIFDHSEPNMPALGVYGAVSYQIWALVLIWLFPQPYENFWFRFAESVLALPLMFYRQLPASLRKPFPYYFIFYTLVTCPFFFFFMTMKNEWSEVWTTTALGGILVVIVITYDWLFILVLMTLDYIAAHVIVTMLDGGIRYTYLDWTYIVSFVFSVSGVMVATRWMRSYQEMRFTILKSLSGSIAHEMRNALNAVSLSIESVRGLLPRNPVDAPENRQETVIPNASLSTIHNTIDLGAETLHRANKIIDSILSSLTGRRIDQSHFRKLSARSSIRFALENYGFSDAEEQSLVRVNDTCDFEFLGDQDLFSNLLTNLLKNALYYRYVEGFRVEISTQALQTGNRIVIRDTGPGIEADRLERVFQPFYTFGKPGGNGIGLAYCRRIVSAFSGNIICRSVVGQWTEFIIDLPAYDGKPVESLKQEILGDKKILIVDDQPANRVVLQKFLGDMHCECDQAPNGLVALEMAGKKRYDLVLMDIEMPELNGDEAVRRLRNGIGIERSMVQHYLKVPIVGVTALPEEEGLRRSLGSGMDECVFKPVRKQDVASLLEKYFFTERLPAPEVQIDLKYDGNILIVEDNMVSREFLKAMLEPLGYKVFQAENGQRALEMLENNPVDLVIMDMEMPVMDGIEASKIIRSGGRGERLERYRHLPIIMLSGYTDKEAINAARETDINYHLGKPVRKLDLVKAISDLLNQAEMQRTCGEAQSQPVLPSNWKGLEEVELLDYETIDSLKELGDEEFIANLFNLFIEESCRIIADLEDACEKGDRERAVRDNHTLKGSAANIGASRILAISNRISEALREGDCPAEEGWTEVLRQVCRLTGEALTSITAVSQVSGGKPPSG